jgi:hypothetical protein
VRSARRERHHEAQEVVRFGAREASGAARFARRTRGRVSPANLAPPLAIPANPPTVILHSDSKASRAAVSVGRTPPSKLHAEQRRTTVAGAHQKEIKPSTP